MNKQGFSLMLMLIFVVVVFTCSNTAFAFKAREDKSGLEAKEFRADNLYIPQAPVPVDQVLSQMQNNTVWNDFLNKNVGSAYIDPRSGRPASLTHSIPFIPGTGQGNNITLGSLTALLGYQVDKVNESVVKNLTLRFLAKYSALLNINMKEIGEIRAVNTDGDYLWHIHIQRQINGIPVRSSKITITVNHGNVVVWGLDQWNDVNVNLNPTISKEQALDAAFNYVGGKSANDKVGKGPHLEIMPIDNNWSGVVGKGYDHMLAWVFPFQREGYANNWEMIVDAHSGKLVSMQDTNQYAIRKIIGAAYPLSNDNCSPQGVSTVTPMAYTDTGQASPNNYTDFGGKFDCTGSAATTTLSGRYVDVNDNCGSISEFSTSGCGDIDMAGVNAQHDCTIPTGHSAGDTMSSRSAGAEIPQINRMAASYINYAWVNSAVTCNVNLNSTCNAYWNGTINLPFRRRLRKYRRNCSSI